MRDSLALLLFLSKLISVIAQDNSTESLAPDKAADSSSNGFEPGWAMLTLIIIMLAMLSLYVGYRGTIKNNRRNAREDNEKKMLSAAKHNYWSRVTTIIKKHYLKEDGVLAERFGFFYKRLNIDLYASDEDGNTILHYMILHNEVSKFEAITKLPYQNTYFDELKNNMGDTPLIFGLRKQRNNAVAEYIPKAFEF